MSELITPEEFIQSKEFIKALKDIDKGLQDVLKTIGTASAVVKKYHEEVKKGASNQKELSENQKKANDTTKQTIAIEKEQERIEKELAKTKAKLALATSNQNKQLVEEKKRLKDVTDQVNGVTEAEKKRRANIGKYKEDIMKAYAIITGALLVAKTAFNSVAAAINENEQVSEFLERKIGGLSAAFGVLRGKLFEFLEGLISTNESSIKWGDGFRHFLSAITQGMSDLIPSIRNLGKEMNDAAKQSEELIRKQQELDDLEGQRIKRRSEANKALALAKFNTTALDKTEQEKAENLRLAIKLEDEILAEEIEYQNKVIANLIAIGELKKTQGKFDTGREGLTIAKEQAKLNDLETESALRKRKAVAALNKLNTTDSVEEDKKKGEELLQNVLKRKNDERNAENEFNSYVLDEQKKRNEEKLAEEEQITDDIIAQKEREKEAFERAEKDKQRAAEETRNLQIDVANAVFDLGSAFNSREISELEAKKEKEIKAAGDNAKKKEKIETEYAKKVGALRRKQAILDKVQALFNIGLNTAIGVANAASKVVTLPLVPYIKLLGALQAAAVLATPLPKFFKGVKDFKGGPAVVGEKGMELVETPKGSFLTPDKATTMLLPEHSTVHTHEKTIEKLKEMDSSKVNELIKEQRLTRKAIGEQVHHSTIITPEGWRETTKKANSNTTHIDKYFRC